MPFSTFSCCCRQLAANCLCLIYMLDYQCYHMHVRSLLHALSMSSHTRNAEFGLLLSQVFTLNHKRPCAVIVFTSFSTLQIVSHTSVKRLWDNCFANDSIHNLKILLGWHMAKVETRADFRYHTVTGWCYTGIWRRNSTTWNCHTTARWEHAVGKRCTSASSSSVRSFGTSATSSIWYFCRQHCLSRCSWLR